MSGRGPVAHASDRGRSKPDGRRFGVTVVSPVALGAGVLAAVGLLAPGTALGAAKAAPPPAAPEPAAPPPTAPTAPASIPGPSFEEVLRLREPLSVAISPDGSAVAFEVRSVDWTANRFDREIWLARAGEEPFPLTRTAGGDSRSPRWSPDGKWIAFVAERGGPRQVHLIRAWGGEAQRLTDVAGGVGDFRWSPDGRSIAFTRQEPAEETDKRRQRYGDFAVEDTEFRQSHLWLVEVKPDPWPSPEEAPCEGGEEDGEEGSEEDEAADASKGAGRGEAAGGEKPPGGKRPGEKEPPAAGGDAPAAAAPSCARLPEPRRLTGGASFTVDNFEWSPDGTRIAFERQSDPLITSYTTADVAVVTVASGAIADLVVRPGYDGAPLWSPDSAWVLFETTEGDTTSDYYLNNRLAKVPATGGEPMRLAAGFDENVGARAWTPAGIFFLAFQKTARPLFRLDPDSGRVEPFAATPRRIWGIDFSADGSTAALVADTDTTLAEVYRTGLSPFAPAPLTDFTAQIAGWKTGTSEVISWKSQDGATIEGVLHKPPGFAPGAKHPLLVVIHGGPTGIDVPDPAPAYVYPVLQWLAKGALVLRPNYRGSAGYGEAFRSLNVRNLGVGDAWDVLSGVDHLIAQGIADPERLGAMGWSQGGYISAFLTTNSDRFRAISVGAGISDWATYYVNTDIHPFTRQYLKATPWEDPEIYAKTSPMSSITRARTPTLIQHGEFDRRVPIPNAYELFQGLQDMRVPARLVVYKGFGHGIDKPKERLAALWHNWQWFARYVWGEEVELPP